jgi:hypothetical protein
MAESPVLQACFNCSGPDKFLSPFNPPRGCDYCKTYGPPDSRGVIYSRNSKKTLQTPEKLFTPPSFVCIWCKDEKIRKNHHISFFEGRYQFAQPADSHDFGQPFAKLDAPCNVCCTDEYAEFVGKFQTFVNDQDPPLNPFTELILADGRVTIKDKPKVEFCVMPPVPPRNV